MSRAGSDEHVIVLRLCLRMVRGKGVSESRGETTIANE